MFLATCALLLAGCSDDKTTEPTGDGDLLASATVGAEGGEVSAEEIGLTVPAGALDVPTTLSIHKAADAHPFGVAGQAVYELKGIPESLGAPLALRVRGQTGESDSQHVFIGEIRESQSGGRELTWFEIPCEDSLGWCYAELPRGAYDLAEDIGARDAAGKSALPTLRVATVSGLHQVISAAGHFELIGQPEVVTTSMLISLAARMEAGFDSVWALGFHFGEQDTIWPLKVYFRNLVAEEMLFARYFIAPHGKGHFEFDPLIFYDEILLSAVPIHEVFHCAQDFYDYRPPEEWKTLNAPRIWLDEACSSWIEKKTSTESEFSPIAMTDGNYEVELWHGLHPPKSTWMSCADYGYGMSSLIEYIADAQGEGRVEDIYAYFVSSQASVEDCLLDVPDPPLEEWISDYHRALVEEEIYVFNDGACFNTMAIDKNFTPEDSPWENTHDLSANPFSAKWERWTISDPRPEPAAGLVFRIDYEERAGAPPSQAAIFGLRSGHPPELLVMAPDSVRLGNLPRLRAIYDSFLFFVSRPENIPQPGWFSDDLPYSWEVELVDAIDLSRFETSVIQLRYHPIWHNGAQQDYKSINFSSSRGVWTANQYVATWDSLDAGVRHFGEIRINVDPDTRALQTWSLNGGWDYPTGDYSRWQANGTGMGLGYSDDNSLEWGVTKSATRGVVTDIFEEHTSSGELWRRLVGFDCNEYSYLTIRVGDQR
jgi:hypothetical protein